MCPVFGINIAFHPVRCCVPSKMSVSEIQREISNLSDIDLNRISAALVSERRKRAGIDLDAIIDRADTEGRWVDWDDVKDDLLSLRQIP